MRLKPPVTRDEALHWLRHQLAESEAEQGGEAAAALDRIADAMVAVSAADVPADVEPLPLSMPVPVRD